MCSNCGAKFASERLLRDHMRRHGNLSINVLLLNELDRGDKEGAGLKGGRE